MKVYNGVNKAKLPVIDSFMKSNPLANDSLWPTKATLCQLTICFFKNTAWSLETIQYYRNHQSDVAMGVVSLCEVLHEWITEHAKVRRKERILSLVTAKSASAENSKHVSAALEESTKAI